MAKERLSKLQKWILTKCYEAGKDYYATPDYWRGRHYLVFNRIKEHCEEHKEEIEEHFNEIAKVYKKYIGPEERKRSSYNWFKDEFEVSTTNSLKSLAKKGYVKLLNKDRWTIRLDSRYRQATVFVQLTDKGVKAVEKVLTIK